MPWSPEKRAKYDAERKRASAARQAVKSRALAAVADYGANLDARNKALKTPTPRPFVAIDSEGVSFGPLIPVGDGTAQKQRTIFWGAATAESQPVWLCPHLAGDADPFCHSELILDWLCALPMSFGPKAIYVWFGSSYDASQIFADMPYEKAWEIQNGKPWRDKDAPDSRKRLGRYVIWKGFAISYLKQKFLRIGRLRNANRPRDPKTGKFEFLAQVTIYDVFGFFQTSFLNAAKSIPGSMTEAEAAIIEDGKKLRGEFQLSSIGSILKYTEAELHVLARMMESLRETLEDLDLKFSRWQGAGTIAATMFRQEKVKEHFWPVLTDRLPLEQEMAHRAFFGGRIETMKQGFHPGALYSYDVRSAYPFNQADLPSMAGGTFRQVQNVSRETVESANILSMFEIDFHCDVCLEGALSVNLIGGAIPGPAFYPLPYRDHKGRITFPPRARGVYMQREAACAYAWRDYWTAHFRKKGYDLACSIEIRQAMIFHPANDEKPFAFLRAYYDERRAIKEREKRTGVYDLTEKVIKLGVNSAYGKTAQSVGAAGRAPGTASPWYAAAITAGTRAQLIRAAMSIPPGSIVAFMTDGIISTRPLDVIEGEELGAWEAKKIPNGGMFFQPGVYILGAKPKHRGVKPDMLNEPVVDWLTRNCRDAWARGEPSFSSPYRYYMTLGAALASPERWQLCGHWVDARRELRLDNLGFKRLAPAFSKDKKARAEKLIDTTPAPAYFFDGGIEGTDFPLSALYMPEWLDINAGLENELAQLNEEISLAREE